MPRVHVARTDLPYVQMKSRLPEIMEKIAVRSKEGTKAIADQIAEGAKQRVPVRTGDLRDAIHVEFQGGAHLGANLEAEGDWSVVAGSGEVFYGHLVEYGTQSTGAGGGGAAPHPFLTPAAEAVVPTIWASMAARLKNL